MVAQQSMDKIRAYVADFENYLNEQNLFGEPENLYAPIDYIMRLPGKRVRPALCLMTADILGEKNKNTLEAAYILELFHNFSLVHDDLMDDADTRRGNTTVHIKWNPSTAILSGDLMLVQCFERIQNMSLPMDQKTILSKAFTNMAKEVCEGQQMDMDFEESDTVSTDDYLEMISRKTAALLGTCLLCGAATVDNITDDVIQHLYQAGIHAGIVFQMRDDWLDTFGDPELVGKKHCGDIKQNKKTWLWLHMLSQMSTTEKNELAQLLEQNKTDLKITRVLEWMNKYRSGDALLEEIKKNLENCHRHLFAVNANDFDTDDLAQLFNYFGLREK